MILTRSSITLTWERDIASVTWYYKLQASTASVPAKPTTETPTGWTDTEPSYTEGSTNSLYIVQKTKYSDGTFSYSSVSLSSSYEAAKAAYNKSVAAHQTAQAAQDSIDNLQVGGRNLYIVRDAEDGYINSSTGAVSKMQAANREQISDFISVTEGETIFFQAWARTTATGNADGSAWLGYAFYDSEKEYLGTRPSKYDGVLQPDGYTYNFYKITVPAGASYIRCSYRRVEGGMAKVERATIATDWSPSPEDMLDDAYIAAVSPISSHTFIGVIGTADNVDNASFYFAKVHPEDYYEPWKVRLRIACSVPSDATFRKTVDITIMGCRSSYLAYDALVANYSSNPLYYVNLFRATQAGISASKGHALGFGLRSSSSPADANKARTFDVDLLEAYGCSMDWIDPAVKYANMDGAGKTYYNSTSATAHSGGSYSELGVASNGQNATNNTNTNYQQHGAAVKAGANGVRSYSLIMKDTDSTWSSFYSSAYNGTATGKEVCTTGFLLGSILYSSGAPSGGNYAAGANTSTVYDGYPLDFRYSSNCASTLVSYKPVYLVGEMHDDGLFYLDETWWTQTAPTSEDGKTYVYVGEAYSTYQVWLSVENKAYQFYGDSFMTYEEAQDARARAAAENVRTYAESLISQKSDEIELSITTVTGTLATDIQGVRDTLSQTADGISGDMQELSQRVTDQEDALLDYKHEASTYFRFNTNGLNIGKQEDGDDSPYSINIDNEKMGFLQNGQEIAYVQYNKMHINAIEAMDRLSVGAAADGGYFDFISTEFGMGIKWRAVANSNET